MRRVKTLAAAASLSMAASSPSPMRVCFLTDVEGSWSYVRRVVGQSSCLRFRDAPHERELALADDCLLVFGGDAGDKGDDTLHCYAELVRLKRAHPDRVVLLVGNRDVNKMRFTSELHASERDLLTMAPQIRDGPVWVPEDRRMTLTKFLAKKVAERSETCSSDQPLDLASPGLEAVNTDVNRLHWMLNCTMGSPGDFERRRKELLALHAKAEGAAVSDDDVVQSFARSVDAGGVIRDFLLEGCLAFVAHGTLFVHGGIVTKGIPSDPGAVISALGHVPGDPTHYENVHEWVDKLNAWYQCQLREWLDQPTWTKDRSTRGGNGLMEYVLPPHKRSVIMGRHLDDAGMPVALPASVARQLEASGITRLIVGHTPHGTCPTVIKQPPRAAGDDDSGSSFKEVIMCDTSYSDMSSPDNRGIAASDVVLHADQTVQIQGVLENGRSIRFTTENDDHSVSLIGRLLRDGTRVKAKLADTEKDEYLVFQVKNGYSYTYAYRSLAQMEETGFVDETASE